MKNIRKTVVSALVIAAIATPLALVSCSQTQSHSVPGPVKSTQATPTTPAPVLKVKQKASTTSKIDAIEKVDVKADAKDADAKTVNTESDDNAVLSDNDINAIVSQGVSKNALETALNAYQWADKEGKLQNKRYLTIVNFNLPSNEKRLQVIDLQEHDVIYNIMVSHGKGSGPGAIATKFSDVPNSKASVLGAMVTGSGPYYGKHGKSLKVNGIESINKNANSRAIEVHPANYATPAFAQAHGRLGASWGCFAVAPNVSTPIINKIEGGSLILAYDSQLHGDSNYSVS